MAAVYGNLEKAKRKLNIATEDVSQDTYLLELRVEVSSYLNDRLSKYVSNPSVNVVEDESLKRIATLFIVGFFLTERSPLGRQGRRLSGEMEADFRVKRAEFELTNYLSAKYVTGVPPATATSSFDRVDGKGLAGKELNWWL
jgi:hypothetical protein